MFASNIKFCYQQFYTITLFNSTNNNANTNNIPLLIITIVRILIIR